MRKRILATLLIVALCFGARAVWNTVKSPVTGAATAAQLDDTAQSYVVASAIRENIVERTIGLLGAGLVFVVWIIPAKKNNQQNNKKT